MASENKDPVKKNAEDTQVDDDDGRAEAEDEAKKEDEAKDEDEAKEEAEDEDEDEDEERSDEEDADEEAEVRRPTKREKKGSKRSGKTRKRSTRASAVATDRAVESVTRSRAILFAAVTLIAGVALGWALRDARTEDGAPTVEIAEGSTPCDTWKDEICKGTSAESAACSGAKATAAMLPVAACNAALADMPGTLDRIKAARASCDKLLTKLCGDLGKESTGCQLVTAKTPSIPPEACDDMLGKYDEVLGQLKMIGQRPPGMPGMGGPGMGGPGMSGPGGPPRGMRPVGPPPGMRGPSQPGAPGTSPPHTH
jgi:hypothetical protein